MLSQDDVPMFASPANQRRHRTFSSSHDLLQWVIIAFNGGGSILAVGQLDNASNSDP